MNISRAEALEAARLSLGVSMEQLWVAYMALGGSVMPAGLEAFLSGSGPLAAHDHDMVAHALNERFSDRGQDHPLPYAGSWPSGS